MLHPSWWCILLKPTRWTRFLCFERKASSWYYHCLGGALPRTARLGWLCFLSVCLSVWLSVYLSVSLLLCASVCLSVSVSACLSVCLSVSLTVGMYIFLSFCMSAWRLVGLSVFNFCQHVCLHVYMSIWLTACLFSFPMWKTWMKCRLERCCQCNGFHKINSSFFCTLTKGFSWLIFFYIRAYRK